ncbi:GDP-fucose transporter [Lachnellula hyalina]|uniref:GDP-mannose transporter n=1 Tax=Lachnellula hyalina TaxID=1316788 RepID=A0A8H8QXU6_9HELO|nr:GDP-fucose transporter [Lachnellula hyalina]TVY24719.1 GDP-fucose transporter [Lachnellula hyalina]
MFSLRNNETFRPALQYLLSAGKPRANHYTHQKSSSSGSIDSDSDAPRARMNPKNSTGFRSTSIPLISISRSPSPYARSPSNPASDTDDDDWGDGRSSSRRPFLPSDGYKLTGWRALLYGGGFGQWLFTTQSGWAIYIGVLVFWLGGCQIGLTIMNRIILWSGYLQDNYTSHTKLMVLIAGVYKFPYPLTTTLIEMLLTHCWILLSAYITRWVSPWLTSAGVSSMISPSKPLPTSSPGFRGQQKNLGFIGSIARWTSGFSGGIAGGGLFEFEWPVVKQCLPVAIIFVAKVSLSNLSFAYAQLTIYTLARVGIVPLSLLFTAFLTGASHSVSTLSSTLTATLTLLVATMQTNVRVTWQSIVAGVFSSIFVALYPVQLHRTYKSLVASLVPQGELIGTFPSSSAPADYSGSREEARAYWRLLHYTSTLSILILTPIVFLSGEISNISRNCYFLDVFFHWLMVFCGGLGSWAVFFSTIALTRATSPLTSTFLFIPRAAFLLPIMAGFKMPSYAWIGIGMCWASCAWFLLGRRRGGRPLERLR